MIEVKGFCKAYDGDAIAVDRLSFSLLPGQVLGLVGRNGAGKTTTLRALTGIIPSSGGTLRVGGFDLSSHPLDVKKLTAYVPDDPQLFSDLTVLQHLQFQASVYGVKKPGPEITRLLEMFELEPKRNSAASSLSRGMRQKLAICCAYLQNPKALLLDEPMTGLDPQAIRVLKQSVVEQAKAGVAVVISSHLLAMVEDICTHVLVLNSGKCKFYGTLCELRKKFGNEDDCEDAASLEHAFFSALSEVEEAFEQEINLKTEGSAKDVTPPPVTLMDIVVPTDPSSNSPNSPTS